MPQLDVRPFRDNTSNEYILDAIRKNASPDYQSRIPEATKAGVQDTLRHLTDYRPAWNEFVDALVNRIGLVIVKNKIWTNPLSKFKSGMLTMGDTIEEINVGLIKSRVYNSDRLNLERDIFGQYPPDVQTSFHKVNRKEYYPITVNEPLLQQAFIDNNGLSSFISALMDAPVTSDQWDEFLLTMSLFKEYYDAGGFFKVNVPDISAVASTEANAKAFLRQARSMAGKLSFISTHYNAAGMPIAANPDELELFITPEALAAVDVEALAGAFNIESAKMMGRITVVPAENVDIPGFQAVLTTRDFFVIADQRIETASQYNPVALSSNYFLHHWGVVSASRFVPAILFTTEAGTVITVDDTPVTSVSEITVHDGDGVEVTAIERGALYQIVGSAITTPTGGANDAVRLELSGNADSRSKVTQTGTLYASPEETGQTFTVTAYAVDDNSELATVSVEVFGDTLNLWPNPGVTADPVTP